MKKIILIVTVLAVLDAVTTLMGIAAGTFYEANPVMRSALQAGAFWFLLLKAGLTLLWAAVMFREAHRRWLAGVNAGVASGYAFVVLRSLILLV